VAIHPTPDMIDTFKQLMPSWFGPVFRFAIFCLLACSAVFALGDRRFGAFIGMLLLIAWTGFLLAQDLSLIKF
jgi:hypothetical protein